MATLMVDVYVAPRTFCDLPDFAAVCPRTEKGRWSKLVLFQESEKSQPLLRFHPLAAYQKICDLLCALVCIIGFPGLPASQKTTFIFAGVVSSSVWCPGPGHLIYFVRRVFVVSPLRCVGKHA